MFEIPDAVIQSRWGAGVVLLAPTHTHSKRRWKKGVSAMVPCHAVVFYIQCMMLPTQALCYSLTYPPSIFTVPDKTLL